MSVRDIDRDGAMRLLEDDNVLVLDVRTKEELLETPTIVEDAIHIDYRAFDFEEQVDELDKSKTYIVICRVGVRSFAACNVMAELGFEDIYNLRGGIFSFDQPCNS